MFVEVRDPKSGKLLFRYDPDTDTIEVKHKGADAVRVVLTPYRAHVVAEQ